MPEFTGQRDIRSYLRILWRWKYLFLAFVVVCPLAAYFLERGKPKIYQSSALVGINSESVDTTLLNTGGGGFSTSNVLAIAQLVKTTPVAEVAAGFMHPRADPSQIAGEVTASGDPATNFLTITAQDTNPVRAAEIANAFAKAIGLNRQNAAVQELDSAIAGIQAQLSRLKPKNAATRAGLEQQLTQLKAAASSQSSEAAVLQAASPNYTSVGPHLHRTVELGLVIGLLLAFGAVVLAESADRRMRSPDDLEGLTDLPLLASISQSAFREGLQLDPVDAESFQMLRTSLTYFNVDQRLSSLLITSPGEKEGKTTVASRLATATASAGSEVILVDADLRRAGVSDRFSLDVPDGLGAVLAGRLDALDALTDVPLEPDAAGHLRVLPAGHPPPNPSALMSSERMQELVRELESSADVVIIDSPAALAVSDSVPLMKAVTGVVLVARMNQSDQGTVARLRRIIENAHGNLLGVVATGVSSGTGYGHYTRSYYSARRDTPGRQRRFRRRKGHSTSNTSGSLLLSPPEQQTVSSQQD
jgi:capsular exopolysaccharide synthesis family protein